MKKLTTLSLMLVLSATLSSCNLSQLNTPSDESIQTAVAMSVGLTQAAATLTAVLPEATPTNEIPTITPETPTPTLTLEPSLTPTMQGVWLTLQENTNCRSGPGSIYDWLGMINAGQLVEAMARNPANDYFYVRNPATYSDFCWLWGKHSTVTGNIAFLPVFTPQPTPTPEISPTPTAAEADFAVSFHKVVSCSGSYAIELYLENTGSIIWQSVKVVLTDTTESKTYTHQLNTFRGVTSDACVLDVANEQEDLVNGEGSLVACINSGQFSYDPTGHSFTAKVTLYSLDDRIGTSVTKTIDFTP